MVKKIRPKLARSQSERHHMIWYIASHLLASSQIWTSKGGEFTTEDGPCSQILEVRVKFRCQLCQLQSKCCFDTGKEIGMCSVSDGGYPGLHRDVVREFLKKEEVKTFSSKHNFEFSELLKNMYFFRGLILYKTWKADAWLWTFWGEDTTVLCKKRITCGFGEC